MANLNEDEKLEVERDRRKYDLLLQFIDGEMYKQYENLRSGKAPKITGDGEIDNGPPESEFLDNVESLPSRRVGKPPVKDDYIAQRMLGLAGKLAAKGIEVSTPEVPVKPGEKTWTYERKVLRKKDG